MVTNNAPLCHRHLRVKVKKHICHSRRTAEDDGKRWRRGRAGIKDCGMEGRRETEEKRSCRLRYGTEKKLIYWSRTFMQGGAEGVV